MPVKRPKLTEQQKHFADEYLTDLNATRAYRAAYPKTKNDNTAAASGAKLLRNYKVKEYIDKRIKQRMARIEVTQDRVIQELAAIAFAKDSDYVTIDRGAVQVKDTKDLTENQQRAIASVKECRDGIEVKLYDKQRALELLGKHLGMFRDRIEIAPSVSSAAQKIAEILDDAGRSDVT